VQRERHPILLLSVRVHFVSPLCRTVPARLLDNASMSSDVPRATWGEPRPSSYMLRFVSDPRNAPSMLNDVRPAFRQISLDAPVSFAREWRLAHEPAPEIRRRCMTSIPCGSVWATSAPFLRLGARLQSLPSRVSERPVQLAAANSPAGLALDMSFREGRGWPESVKAGSAKLTGRT
jgi:hypothetical protein